MASCFSADGAAAWVYARSASIQQHHGSLRTTNPSDLLMSSCCFFSSSVSSFFSCNKGEFDSFGERWLCCTVLLLRRSAAARQLLSLFNNPQCGLDALPMPQDPPSRTFFFFFFAFSTPCAVITSPPLSLSLPPMGMAAAANATVCNLLFALYLVCKKDGHARMLSQAPLCRHRQTARRAACSTQHV